jgi:hypothetical protein
MKGTLPMRMIRKITFIALMILVLSLMVVPGPCPAKTSVTVHIAFGGVACGGVGLYFYFFHSSALYTGGLAPGPAIINIRGDNLLWGFPMIGGPEDSPGSPAGAENDLIELKLMRWEF